MKKELRKVIIKKIINGEPCCFRKEESHLLDDGTRVPSHPVFYKCNLTEARNIYCLNSYEGKWKLEILSWLLYDFQKQRKGEKKKFFIHNDEAEMERDLAITLMSDWF